MPIARVFRLPGTDSRDLLTHRAQDLIPDTSQRGPWPHSPDRTGGPRTARLARAPTHRTQTLPTDPDRPGAPTAVREHKRRRDVTTPPSKTPGGKPRTLRPRPGRRRSERRTLTEHRGRPRGVRSGTTHRSTDAAHRFVRVGGRAQPEPRLGLAPASAARSTGVSGASPRHVFGRSHGAIGQVHPTAPSGPRCLLRRPRRRRARLRRLATEIPGDHRVQNGAAPPRSPDGMPAQERGPGRARRGPSGVRSGPSPSARSVSCERHTAGCRLPGGVPTLFSTPTQEIDHLVQHSAEVLPRPRPVRAVGGGARTTEGRCGRRHGAPRCSSRPS
ncbi:hypothetical protein BCL76_115102 [Streptomyces sp. CG 926]|nr:hypothetical protein BCL76_115102 [Streptomyces sp. CG 926]